MVAVSYVVEGATDEPVAQALLASAGASIGRRVVTGGKSRLDPKIPGLIRSARPEHPWLVLRDLDMDDRSSCRGDVVTGLCRGRARSNGFVLRLAVRSTESWLLADRRGFGSFFGVAASTLPRDPDVLDDPKRTLIGLAARSAKREVREGAAPPPGSPSRTGRRYVELVGRFVQSRWDIDRARTTSASLDRALDRLSAEVARWL